MSPDERAIREVIHRIREARLYPNIRADGTKAWSETLIGPGMREAHLTWGEWKAQLVADLEAALRARTEEDR